MLRNRTYNRKVAKTFMVLVRLLERICVSETHSTVLNMFLKHTFTTGSRFEKEDFMFEKIVNKMISDYAKYMPRTKKGRNTHKIR